MIKRDLPALGELNALIVTCAARTGDGCERPWIERLLHTRPAPKGRRNVATSMNGLRFTGFARERASVDVPNGAGDGLRFTGLAREPASVDVPNGAGDGLRFTGLARERTSVDLLNY